MLKHLEIQNYALIEHLSIDFSEGFTVLTGETGAGKSIIMGALALVLGQRADAKSIQEGKNKCVVEAIFDITDYELDSFFEENDLDYASETVVRREVQDNGKSRAFVNDTPTNLNVLRDLTSKLIDIHSQHQNLLLMNEGFQLEILDAVAGVKELKNNYRQVYTHYAKHSSELLKLQETADSWRSERDYAQFQFSQLEEARLQENEQIELEKELEVLNHAEEIKTSLLNVSTSLDSDENGILVHLKEAFAQISRIRNYLNESDLICERMESVRIELKDIASEIVTLLNRTDFNPNRKQEIEERLNLIYNLQQKHRVGSISELLHLLNEFEQKLMRIDSFDEELEVLRQKLSEIYSKMSEEASKLTQKRLSVCDEISHKMELLLQCLGMPNAQFMVSVLEQEHYSIAGKETISFLFTANKNATLKKITEIASGGEISRVMLSIKSLIVSKSFLPTIIFDEIDTGVSGGIANRMGEIMQQISKKMQVITITHLPQIAAKGASHYKVYKSDNEMNTVTSILRLSENERVSEIAEMLSGKNLSQAALDNAKELLST